MAPDPEEDPLARTLEKLGEGSSFVWMIFFFTMFPTIFAGMHSHTYIFIAEVPSHWCAVPELSLANWTDEQIRNVSSADSCSRYDYNYSRLAEMGFEESLKYLAEQAGAPVGRLECAGYSYANDVDRRSMVEEWDLVCGEAPKRPLTHMALSLGKLIGAGFLGASADKYGRRSIYVLGILVFVLAGPASAFVPWYWGFVALRLLTGLSFSAVQFSALTTLTEVAGNTHRQWMAIAFNCGFASGSIFVAGIAYLASEWRQVHAGISEVVDGAGQAAGSPSGAGKIRRDHKGGAELRVAGAAEVVAAAEAGEAQGPAGGADARTQTHTRERRAATPYVHHLLRLDERLSDVLRAGSERGQHLGESLPVRGAAGPDRDPGVPGADADPDADGPEAGQRLALPPLRGAAARHPGHPPGGDGGPRRREPRQPLRPLDRLRGRHTLHLRVLPDGIAQLGTGRELGDGARRQHRRALQRRQPRREGLVGSQHALRLARPPGGDGLSGAARDPQPAARRHTGGGARPEPAPSQPSLSRPVAPFFSPFSALTSYSHFSKSFVSFCCCVEKNKYHSNFPNFFYYFPISR